MGRADQQRIVGHGQIRVRVHVDVDQGHPIGGQCDRILLEGAIHLVRRITRQRHSSGVPAQGVELSGDDPVLSASRNGIELFRLHRHEHVPPQRVGPSGVTVVGRILAAPCDHLTIQVGGSRLGTPHRRVARPRGRRADSRRRLPVVVDRVVYAAAVVERTAREAAPNHHPPVAGDRRVALARLGGRRLDIAPLVVHRVVTRAAGRGRRAADVASPDHHPALPLIRRARVVRAHVDAAVVGPRGQRRRRNRLPGVGVGVVLAAVADEAAAGLPAPDHDRAVSVLAVNRSVTDSRARGISGRHAVPVVGAAPTATDTQDIGAIPPAKDNHVGAGPVGAVLPTGAGGAGRRY